MVIGQKLDIEVENSNRKLNQLLLVLSSGVLKSNVFCLHNI